MSKRLEAEVMTLKQNRSFVGLKKTMKEDAMFQEAKVLAGEYAAIKGQIKNLILPVYTGVITFAMDEEGSYDYFMGDEVSSVKGQELFMQKVVLPKGTCVARVQVKAGFQMTLSYKAASIRKQFYTEWLQEHGYVSACPLEDMELYHYRRRRFRKAVKLVMELYFFIEKRQER